LVLETPTGLKKKVKEVDKELSVLQGVQGFAVEGWKMASKQSVINVHAKITMKHSKVLPRIEEILERHDIKHSAI
jgi:hypothetical protein